MVGAQKSRYRRAQDQIRIFNKWLLNPVARRFAGRPGSPYGLVRHVGRRSGRTYDTPVLVGTEADQFVVPLPYGTDTDWYRNVRAADECIVVWQGSAYETESPRLVDPVAVPSAFPAGGHRLIQQAGAEQYLRMDRGAERPDVYREITKAYPARPALVAAAGVFLVAFLARRARRSGE